MPIVCIGVINYQAIRKKNKFATSNQKSQIKSKLTIK